MKTCLLILIAVTVTYCLPADFYKPEWEKFKKQYNRNYSPEEEEFRFKLFCKTLDIIRKHNEDYEKGLTTFKMGVNQFADLTLEEKQKWLGLHSFYAGSDEVKSTYLPAEVYQEEWKKFKNIYKKLYESPEEEKRRFEFFCDNLDKIRYHNELYDKGLVTYKMGINKYADVTPEEFEKMMGLKPKEQGLNQEPYEDCEVIWQKFKKQFNRHYSAEEEQFRYKLFCKTLAIITKHNEDYEKGLTTFKMGLNQFADLSPEEKQKWLGTLVLYGENENVKSTHVPKEVYQEEWERFKKRFNKHYDAEEESHRFKIFSENLREIIKHNEDYEKGLSHFRMGITRFTDMTRQEYLKFLEEEAGGVTFAPLQH